AGGGDGVGGDGVAEGVVEMFSGEIEDRELEGAEGGLLVTRELVGGVGEGLHYGVEACELAVEDHGDEVGGEGLGDGFDGFAGDVFAGTGFSPAFGTNCGVGGKEDVFGCDAIGEVVADFKAQGDLD